jgi:hypothetical protein
VPRPELIARKIPACFLLAPAISITKSFSRKYEFYTAAHSDDALLNREQQEWDKNHF